MVAEVTGAVGFTPRKTEDGVEKTPKLKFKFGHYREYQPTEDEMLIEWIEIRSKLRR